MVNHLRITRSKSDLTSDNGPSLDIDVRNIDIGVNLWETYHILEKFFFGTFLSLSASTDLENIFGRKKPELECKNVEDPDCSFGRTHLVIYKRYESL